MSNRIEEIIQLMEERGASIEAQQDFRNMGVIPNDYGVTQCILRRNQPSTVGLHNILGSEFFKGLFDDPRFSVQPMAGPVGMAWSNDFTQKTVVEVGSYYYEEEDPTEGFKTVVMNRHRQLSEVEPNRVLIVCPYLLDCDPRHKGGKRWFRGAFIDNLPGNTYTDTPLGAPLY